MFLKNSSYNIKPYFKKTYITIKSAWMCFIKEIANDIVDKNASDKIHLI